VETGTGTRTPSMEPRSCSSREEGRKGKDVADVRAQSGSERNGRGKGLMRGPVWSVKEERGEVGRAAGLFGRSKLGRGERGPGEKGEETGPRPLAWPSSGYSFFSSLCFFFYFKTFSKQFKISLKVFLFSPKSHNTMEIMLQYECTTSCYIL